MSNQNFEQPVPDTEGVTPPPSDDENKAPEPLEYQLPDGTLTTRTGYIEFMKERRGEQI